MATRKSKSRKQSDDYVAKRNKNNDAVRRSREKARQKHLATQKRVTALKAENEYLEERLQLLAKELKFLKDLFLAHTATESGISVDDLQSNNLILSDPITENTIVTVEQTSF